MTNARNGETPATSLPWATEQIGVSDAGPDGIDVFDIGPCDNLGAMRKRVATVAGDDAAYIVAACNAYPKLLDDRRRLMEAMQYAVNRLDVDKSQQQVANDMRFLLTELEPT